MSENNTRVFTTKAIRYGIVHRPFLHDLILEVNRMLDRGDCRQVGGLSSDANGLYQAMEFSLPPGKLKDEERRCCNEHCDIKDKCLRYREEQDPWITEELHWYHGGPKCNARVIREEGGV